MRGYNVFNFNGRMTSLCYAVFFSLLCERHKSMKRIYYGTYIDEPYSWKHISLLPQKRLSNFPTLCCSMNPIELKNQLISVDELTLRVATRQENSGSKIETFFFHLIRRFPFELNYSIGNVVALALFSTHP